MSHWTYHYVAKVPGIIDPVDRMVKVYFWLNEPYARQEALKKARWDLAREKGNSVRFSTFELVSEEEES